MRPLIVVALGVSSLLSPGPAHASSWASAAGIESFQGPGGTGSRAVLGIGVFEFGRADVLAQGARYQDDVTGMGWSLTAGGGVTLAGPLRARARATRTVGAGTFRASQFRAGPELRFGSLADVAAYYETNEIGDSARTRGLTAEGSMAVAPKLTGRASGSWARDDGPNRAVQASVGGIWRAVPHLDVSADLGWVSTQGTTATSFPAGGPFEGIPLLGGGNNSSHASKTDVVRQSAPTLLLGARVVFP